MDIPAKIATIETKLTAKGLSIGKLCAEAGIDRTTWQRWRNGDISPTMKNWDLVQEALKRIAA